MNVWCYVITYDSGAAPNFEPPLTTLTVCKPRIRKSANVGDLVLAFNGNRLNPLQPHSVRWAGIVSEVITLADYWKDSRFEGKKPGRLRQPGESPDNIYRPIGDGNFEQVENETHKPSAMVRDVGGANALALNPSWYFGRAIAVVPEHFGLRMTGGRRGHRRSEIDEVMWRELKRWLDESSQQTSDSTMCIT